MGLSTVKCPASLTSLLSRVTAASTVTVIGTIVEIQTIAAVSRARSHVAFNQLPSFVLLDQRDTEFRWMTSFDARARHRCPACFKVA